MLSVREGLTGRGVAFNKMPSITDLYVLGCEAGHLDEIQHR
jgi:hypothetical protein